MSMRCDRNSFWVIPIAYMEPINGENGMKEHELNRLITQSFDADELSLLCRDIDIDPDQIKGTDKATRISELISFCKRRGTIDTLTVAVQKARPHLGALPPPTAEQFGKPENKRNAETSEREQFVDEVFTRIAAARSEVIFLGGISSDIISPKKLRLFATALQENPRLRITFLHESMDNLYRRATYLHLPFSAEDSRSIDELLAKRKQVALLKESILERCDNDYRRLVSNRIEVLEVHLQLYATIVKVDDTIYFTPISHRRGSRGICRKLVDVAEPMHRFAREMIEYMRSPLHGAMFCTGSDQEIVPVFDRDSIHVGYLPRAHLRYVPYSCKVVWGVVFDRTGRLLLQRRSDSSADNPRLWDKSFGGHVSRGDSSELQTLYREFSEELMVESDLSSSIHFIGGIPNEEILSAAFRSMNDKWIVFKLVTMNSYESNRKQTDGSMAIQSQIAEVFCLIAPESETLFPDPDIIEELDWVTIGELREGIQKNSHAYTGDIRTIVQQSRDLARKLSFVGDMITKVR